MIVSVQPNSYIKIYGIYLYRINEIYKAIFFCYTSCKLEFIFYKFFCKSSGGKYQYKLTSIFFNSFEQLLIRQCVLNELIFIEGFLEDLYSFLALLVNCLDLFQFLSVLLFCITILILI